MISDDGARDALAGGRDRDCFVAEPLDAVGWAADEANQTV
jgi:hypothetical protein